MAWRQRSRVLVFLVVVTGVVVGVAWLAYAEIGRTPGEMIDYAKRRLQGHTRLEAVALPVLDTLVDWLGEPNDIERAQPFFVPPLDPRPPAPVTAEPASVADPLRIQVGPRRAIVSLALAARAAPDGAVIEVDPGDYVGDVAVWLQRKLTIRGMGPGVRLIAAGRSAEGKAIWVIRRGSFLVENIEFIGARVADRNGAGIRFEGGDLTIRRCKFYDNENGILTGGGPEMRLAIEASEFAYNGAGDGLSHGVYIGDMESFRLTGSYFHHANAGHLVKSRARKNRIEYNRLTDEAGGRASYELEFPDGGEAEVVGNIIQQGSRTHNSVIVSFGAESNRWPINRLVMAHNTLINDRRYGGTFVRVSPGAQAVVLRNNLLVGPGSLKLPSFADSDGDRHVDWSTFVLPSRHDYRLTPAAQSEMKGGSMAPLAAALRPQAEYVHPLGLLPVPSGPLTPGALQSVPN